MATRNNSAPQEANAGEAIRARRGLAPMLAEQGGDKEVVDAAELIEGIPGGPELLYSFAISEMMKKAGMASSDTKKVKLYEIGGYVDKAEGGLAKAAETTRKGGRNGDSMMVHMTPEELGVLEGMWGKADINPNTGMPEYGFFSKIWKKVKKAVKKVFSSKIFQIVAPIALSIFAPGLGTWVGGLLTGGGSGAAASIIGNAVVRGGLSAAGGGDFATGAISGAISGGLGDVAGGFVKDIAPGLQDSTAAVIGSSLASGAGAELTGGDFTTGAMQGAIGQMMQPTMDTLAEKGQDIFNLEAPAEGDILARRTPDPSEVLSEIDLSTLPKPRTGGLGEAAPGGREAMEDMFGEEMGAQVRGGAPAPAGTTPAATPPAAGTDDLLMKYGLPLMTAMGALQGGGYEEEPPPDLPPHMLEPLPLYDSNRQFIGPTDPNAYYTYGRAGAPQTGESLFITPDPFSGETGTPTVGPGPTGGLGAQDQIAALMAQGQPVPANMVRGNGGRLRAAGYTQDQNTGTWMPPPPQLGQGMPGNAMGGYQHGGEFDYWAQNADVQRVSPTVSAAGRYVKGPGTGRSDDIPARLSDGEYVIDAETVALLGDGSGDAGAKRLDEMRSNMRQHKAKNLMKGGFSHKAKSPESYMPRLRAAAGRA